MFFVAATLARKLRCKCSAKKGLAMKSWTPERMASEMSLVWFNALRQAYCC